MDLNRVAFSTLALLTLCVSVTAAEKSDADDTGESSSLSRPYHVPDDPTLSRSDHDSQVLGQDARRQTIVNPVEQGLHPAHRQRSARAAKATLPALKQQMLQNAQ